MNNQTPSQPDTAEGKTTKQVAGFSQLVTPVLRIAAHPAFIIAAAVGIILIASALLWNLVWLRPYLIGVGAALAALISPLSNILIPETRWKWLAAFVVAALIGIGTWLSNQDLTIRIDSSEAQRRQLEEQYYQLEKRFSSYKAPVEAMFVQLGRETGDTFFLGAAARFKILFEAKEYQALIDLANSVTNASSGNGHVLYYMGEANRVLAYDILLYQPHLGKMPRQRMNMRGAFQRYIAESGQRPESRTGSAADCAIRPTGYCAERTAWTLHMMANDYFVEALHIDGLGKITALTTAIKYISWTLDVRKVGFYAIGTVRATCEVMHGIADELKKMNLVIDDVRDVRAKLDSQISCPPIDA